ncbi:MAG: putative oxidoreductase C-terminal domain-containing protein [Bryobacteraceae bacterium]
MLTAAIAGVFQVKLMVLDPGHFHAALLQKEMYPEVSKRVAVYAPLTPDVLDYLNRVSLSNARKDNPTAWEIDLHTGPDFFPRMLQEKPGNVVVMTGRNRLKINRMEASVDAGLHVLADKPWIIESAAMPKLEHVLDRAEQKGVVAYDIMTERFEITSILQRALVNDPEVFGKQVPGTEAEPGITAKSIHHLMKVVAGVPLRRPAWFFDVAEYGEGLADVGTHVVDLVQWTAFPDQKLDYRSDVKMLAGKHWPTVISKADFQKVTGEAEFPASLGAHVKEGKLEYFCNNSVAYALRGVHVKLDILWNWEAVEGGDVYEAVFRGTNARVEIRQGKTEKFVPELYVVSSHGTGALKRKIAALQSTYPGLAIVENGNESRIVIPDRFRVGHESHFAEVTGEFFHYLKEPKSMPAWEKPNMLVKYYISTKGVELSRQ